MSQLTNLTKHSGEKPCSPPCLGSERKYVSHNLRRETLHCNRSVKRKDPSEHTAFHILSLICFITLCPTASFGRKP